MEYCERMGVDPEPENSISRVGSRCGPGQWLDADGIWHSSPCEWDDENHDDDDDAGAWNEDEDEGENEQYGNDDAWEEDGVGDQADQEPADSNWPQPAEVSADAGTEADEHGEWPEHAERAEGR